MTSQITNNSIHSIGGDDADGPVFDELDHGLQLPGVLPHGVHMHIYHPLRLPLLEEALRGVFQAFGAPLQHRVAGGESLPERRVRRRRDAEGAEVRDGAAERQGWDGGGNGCGATACDRLHRSPPAHLRSTRRELGWVIGTVFFLDERLENRTVKIILTFHGFRISFNETNKNGVFCEKK